MYVYGHHLVVYLTTFCLVGPSYSEMGGPCEMNSPFSFLPLMSRSIDMLIFIFVKKRSAIHCNI